MFVGVEIDPGKLEGLPLEMVLRVLPSGKYAFFTPKGKEIHGWEKAFYQEWLPKSGYRLAVFHEYSFQIQAYEERRFKGTGELLEASEIDVYIPIEKSPG
ncbi:MAG: GyrI-like domain-containing protein [Chloroflexota bacterium]